MVNDIAPKCIHLIFSHLNNPIDERAHLGCKRNIITTTRKSVSQQTITIQVKVWKFQYNVQVIWRVRGLCYNPSLCRGEGFSRVLLYINYQKRASIPTVNQAGAITRHLLLRLRVSASHKGTLTRSIGSKGPYSPYKSNPHDTFTLIITSLFIRVLEMISIISSSA